MRVVAYAPDLFGALAPIAQRVGARSSLTHRPFVDHYYARGDWCRLFIILADDGSALATIGLERMPFEYDCHKITLGCGSNFYSLRPGVGSYLFLYWLRMSAASLVLRGSEDTLRILRSQNWRFFRGMRTYVLNRTFRAHSGEPTWRVAAKCVLRHTVENRRLPARALRMAKAIPATLSAREERDYSQDLLPRRSPFRFRFAPSVDYLSWRYSTRLSFVRYRLFRILEKERTVGYVVLNDSPQRILVAQCDGEEAETLAYGVVLSVLLASHADTALRPISLVSSHRRMQAIYERFGFKHHGRDRSLALSPLERVLPMDADTSNWHVNLDWGDEGLFGPFLDQGPPSLARAAALQPITETGV